MPKELHDVLDPYLDKLEQELKPAPPGADPTPAHRTAEELRPRRL
jgi:hypothetical protein